MKIFSLFLGLSSTNQRVSLVLRCVWRFTGYEQLAGGVVCLKTKDFQQINKEHDDNSNQNDKNLKKKQNKSIEEAIEEAIKEEKEIVHAD